MLKKTKLLNRFIYYPRNQGKRLIRGLPRERAESRISRLNSDSELKADFFGIESNVGVKIIKNESVAPNEKYQYLYRKENTLTEKVLPTTFGTVRLDSDNEVKFHGQFHGTFAQTMSDLHPEINKKLKQSSGENIHSDDTELSFAKDKNQRNISNRQSESKSGATDNNQKFDFEDKQESNNYIENQTFAGNERNWNDKHSVNKSKGTNCINIAAQSKNDTRENGQKFEFEDKQESNNYIENQTFAGNKVNWNDKQSANKSKDTNCINELNYVDNQYFDHIAAPNEISDFQLSENNSSLPNIDSTTDVKSASLDSTKGKADIEHHYIDYQYFGEFVPHSEEICPKDNFIEEQYFSPGNNSSLSSDGEESLITTTGIPNHSDQKFEPIGEVPENNRKKVHISVSDENNLSTHSSEKEIDPIEASLFNSPYDKSHSFLEKQHTTVPESKNDLKIQFRTRPLERTETTEPKSQSEEHENVKTDKYVKPNLDQPHTAYDYVMKLRKEKTETASAAAVDSIGGIIKGEKLDSRGMRILKGQVPDFRNVNQEAIVTILKNCILHNADDIVAISKPYGLVCQGGDRNVSGLDLESCLPILAKSLYKTSVNPMLYLVNPIDKNMTGVVLLAKTEKMADYLSNLFNQNEITRVYWALTKGIPELQEGIIDIPIVEGSINGKRRMGLRPEARGDLEMLVKPCKYAKRAVTHYNVISSVKNATLMEVKPETNVKHQVRVHLGFGLGCPIVGDHKYSHLTKLAPQKLPDSMLKGLGIQQSKVRHVPMHLHLKTIVIPQLLDGKNIFFHANLPSHFRTNLQRLKFRKE